MRDVLPMRCGNFLQHTIVIMSVVYKQRLLGGTFSSGCPLLLMSDGGDQIQVVTASDPAASRTTVSVTKPRSLALQTVAALGARTFRRSPKTRA